MTIQSALDRAVDGDIVVVAPGEYLVDEPLDFNRGHDPDDPKSLPPKNIVLQSIGGAAITLIKSANPPRDEAVVVFRHGESRSSALRGFTISGDRQRSVLSMTAKSSPTVIDCRLERGLSGSGGGLFCDEGASPTLISCTIAQNSGFEGAGAYVGRNCRVTLRDCLIVANWARTGASGILCDSGSDLLLKNCVVTGNLGAGLLCRAATVVIENSLLTGNSTYEYKGGVMCFGAHQVTIRNCTISGNLGGVSGDSLHIVNSIVWGNQLYDLRVTGGNEQVFYSCIGGDEPWPGAGNTNEAPRFVRIGTFERHRLDLQQIPSLIVDAGNYRVRADSPCVDSGDSHGSTSIDLVGNRRPCGAGIDMGAYELCGMPGSQLFRRGNANGADGIDIADGVFVLNFLFRGGSSPPCDDAADANDDGNLNIADALFIFGYLYLGHGEPPGPGPRECGVDPTGDDAIGCEATLPECEF